MDMKAIANTQQKAARGDRFDWSEIRDRIDLAAVATNLLGPAPGRRAGKGRLWWRCPFHDDKNPSFHVNPVKRTWKCYGCSEHGDAAALVMKLNRCGFPEAVSWLAEQAGILPPSSRPPSGKPTRPRPPAASKLTKPPDATQERSTGLPLADALKLVEDAARRIWTSEGATALAYLKSRGLTDATIRAARLGWMPEVSLPTSDGSRYWARPVSLSPGSMAIAWRWSRSASPRDERRNTPKRFATVPRCILLPRSFDLASRW